MRNVWKVMIVVGLLLVATSSIAGEFRAADQVYLPAVARTGGGGGAFFVTDVFISNVSTQTVDVWVAYLPTGATNDNSALPASAIKLPTPLAPGERREYVDVAKSLLNLDSANGYLIFFACRTGGDCSDCDTNPADCELITVEGRIYNQVTAGDGSVSTFGQLFPGIPWYLYNSMNSANLGLDKVFITGIRNTGAVGVSGYRTNIGLVNSSQFSSTQLQLTLFDASGNVVGAPALVSLGPLAHTQQPVTNFFPGFAGSGAFVVIQQLTATPVATPPAGCEDGCPGYLAYGSMLDNVTSDPTTLEAQFSQALDVTCVFGAKAPHRMVNHP
ncbi:MAG: hypothetical protein WBX15_12305 [Thermoanaerobaculia bacterium]